MFLFIYFFKPLSVAVNSDCLISLELLHQLLGCHRNFVTPRLPWQVGSETSICAVCLSIDQPQVWSRLLLSSPSAISDGGFIGKQKLQKIKTELKMYVWCGYHLLPWCPHSFLVNYSGCGQKYSWRLQMASQKLRWTKEGLKRIKSSSLGDGPLGGWAWLLTITLSVCTWCMFIANTKWSTVVLNNRAVLHGDDSNTT